MIRRLLDWVNKCWEVLFYLPERPVTKLTVSRKAEDADSIGMVI
jgi:hypothetical protein